MKLLTLLLTLVSFQGFSLEIRLNDRLLQAGQCLQLKKSTHNCYNYISNSSVVLKVLEIIDSESNQIIIYNDKNKSYDYVDQYDVIRANCT